ncbi:MAG: nucleotide pyrophosphohydrolase [Nanoarchaeota archaeon]
MDKFNDKDITINELKKIVQDFCEKRNWDQFHSPKELAIGVSTEAGELLDHFRFKSDEQMKKMFQDLDRKQEISEEIADVFFFLLRFVQMYDIDLSKSLNDKVEKNEKRFPVEKWKNNNLKYNEVEK